MRDRYIIQYTFPRVPVEIMPILRRNFMPSFDVTFLEIWRRWF